LGYANSLSDPVYRNTCRIYVASLGSDAGSVVCASDISVKAVAFTASILVFLTW
jgi:hypothetical protein